MRDAGYGFRQSGLVCGRLRVDGECMHALRREPSIGEKAMRRMLILLVVLAGVPTLATAQSAADSAAIRATALDYI